MNKYLESNKYEDEWFAERGEFSCYDCHFRQLRITGLKYDRCKLTGRELDKFVDDCALFQATTYEDQIKV